MLPAKTGLRSFLNASRGVLVESNILLDVATNDPDWSDWSGRALAECSEYATLFINPIIYAEVSVRYTTIEALDTALPAALYHREALPWAAGFLAGRCFLRYRRQGGARRSPLRISTSALMPLLEILPCSHVTSRATEVIFRN